MPESFSSEESEARQPYYFGRWLRYLRGEQELSTVVAGLLERAKEHRREYPREYPEEEQESFTFELTEEQYAAYEASAALPSYGALFLGALARYHGYASRETEAQRQLDRSVQNALAADILRARLGSRASMLGVLAQLPPPSPVTDASPQSTVPVPPDVNEAE